MAGRYDSEATVATWLKRSQELRKEMEEAMKSYELRHEKTNALLGILSVLEGVTLAENTDLLPGKTWDLRDRHGVWFAVLTDLHVMEVPDLRKASAS